MENSHNYLSMRALFLHELRSLPFHAFKSPIHMSFQIPTRTDKETIRHENWIIEIENSNVDPWIIQHTKFYETSMPK